MGEDGRNHDMFVTSVAMEDWSSWKCYAKWCLFPNVSGGMIPLCSAAATLVLCALHIPLRTGPPYLKLGYLVFFKGLNRS
jgi:hypothetical protein